MRAFQHSLDEQVLRGELSGRWAGEINRVRRTLSEESSVAFSLTDALSGYYEGVCFAWALEEQSALSELRGEVSALIDRTLDAFTPDDVQLHSTYRSLSQAGVGSDPAALRRYGAVLRSRRRGEIRDRDPHAFSDDLLDALVALVVGEDGVAQAASTRLHELLEHPRTPPSVYFGGLPHAIDAVARGDQAALDDAVGFTADLFVRQVMPTRHEPAAANSALYPELSLICRMASWRGMAWPQNPYILAVADPPVSLDLPERLGS